jgi:deoxyribonuclease-4
MRKVGGHVSIAGGLINAVENTKKIGGNCMQIFAGSPRLWARKLWDKKDADNFISVVTSSDFEPVFIHALYLINLATDNSELLQKSIDSLVIDIKNGAQINSAGVIVHIGSHQGRGFDTAKEQIVKSINKILEETKDCDLLLENDAGQNGKIGSIEEIAYLISEINNPRLKVCFDTAHLFEGGLDLRDKKVVNQFIEEIKSQKVLDKLKCIHLNDSATDLDSHRDNHADLGNGKIGLDGLRNFVNHAELIHLPLLLETPGPDKMGPDKENINLAKEISTNTSH